jgi:uncharacterized membrane protein
MYSTTKEAVCEASHAPYFETCAKLTRNQVIKITAATILLTAAVAALSAYLITAKSAEVDRIVLITVYSLHGRRYRVSASTAKSTKVANERKGIAKHPEALLQSVGGVTLVHLATEVVGIATLQEFFIIKLIDSSPPPMTHVCFTFAEFFAHFTRRHKA